eukprot:scaffold224112_cov30-Tisochrysis_lutea.AAC.7
MHVLWRCAIAICCSREARPPAACVLARHGHNASPTKYAQARLRRLGRYSQLWPKRQHRAQTQLDICAVIPPYMWSTTRP